IAELGPRLAKADIGATTRIDEDLRLRADPEKITGVGPILDEARRAGTQDLNGYGISGAALRQSGRGCRDQDEHSGDERANHQCISCTAPDMGSISRSGAESLYAVRRSQPEN